MGLTDGFNQDVFYILDRDVPICSRSGAVSYPVLSALSFLLSHGRTSASFLSCLLRKQIKVNTEYLLTQVLPVKLCPIQQTMRSCESAQNQWQEFCTLNFKACQNVLRSIALRIKSRFDLFTVLWHEAEKGSQTVQWLKILYPSIHPSILCQPALFPNQGCRWCWSQSHYSHPQQPSRVYSGHSHTIQLHLRVM